MPEKGWTTLSSEAKLDIKWFLLYASSANGVALITPSTDYFFIECDACLEGGGGNSPTAYYKWKFDQSHVMRFKSIHALEAVNLLVAYKTLAPLRHHNKLTVVLLTDNIASSCALTYPGSVRSSNLAGSGTSRPTFHHPAQTRHRNPLGRRLEPVLQRP